MSKKEVYRIKDGTVEAEGYNIPFYFGIVYSNNGIISVDLYVKEEYDLAKLLEQEHREHWGLDYTLNGKTEENNSIVIDELSFTQNYPHFSRIKMRSFGKLEHIKTKDRPLEREDDYKPSIYYLLLEGLKIEFSDITENIKARGGTELENFNKWQRDHTAASLFYKRRLYPHTYYKAEESDEIVVQFSNNKHESLKYELYTELKSDFINTLSFLNGAEVKVRKECYGEYYTLGKVDAHKVITYSFSKQNNQRHSRYIPINDAFHRGEHVLSRFLFRNFESFKEWNEKLDLKSIVFYLNNSQQAKSIQESVFIQIIAFERLTTMYVNILEVRKNFCLQQKSSRKLKRSY